MIKNKFSKSYFGKTYEAVNNYTAKVRFPNWNHITFSNDNLKDFLSDIEEVQKTIWWESLLNM